MSLISRWKDGLYQETCWGRSEVVPTDEESSTEPSEKQASGMGKYWAIMTAGAGLFSDGYLNNSVGTASTCLGILYPKEYKDSPAASNVPSITFAGTVLGQLVFGYISDNVSRKAGMMVSTTILIVFALLAAAATWGKDGSVYGLLTALTVFRFFLGLGIGGEYPAGSVACSEATTCLPRGHRHRWFILFTNFMIDFGFVVSAFVPLVLLWIFGKDHLTPVWRLTLGLGAIPPLSLFFLRLKYKESESFQKNNTRKSTTPYWLALKYYGFRLSVLSAIWFLYDFSVYAFGIYSSEIIALIIPDKNLVKVFGWTVVLNLFYIPGSFIGAFASDYLGPRLALIIGVLLQAVIGYLMAGILSHLQTHVAGFVVVYGVFLSLGEFGPGNNIGLLCSRTSAACIRGQFYGIAAAVGKVGAYAGTKAFPEIIKRYSKESKVKGLQAPFWIASSLCILSAFLTAFCLPSVTQESLSEEDEKFKRYLYDHGYDTTQLGDTIIVSRPSESEPRDPKSDSDTKIVSE